jgi:hypothetical protein
MGKEKNDDGKDKKREIYRDAKDFEQKTAEIFRLMGFEVELNRRIAGNDIDILIKRKKPFGNVYEFYVCECKDYEKPVGVEWVNKYVGVQGAAKLALQNEHKGSSCDAMIVARKGFTKDARETAEANRIILSVYDQLLADLMNFDRSLTALIQNFESDPVKDLYIEQDMFPEKEKTSINSFTFIEKWLTQPERKQFSLLGDYGTGKTSFAKKLAYDMAKAYKQEPGQSRIPFLVDLRQCQKALSLNTLIHEQLIAANVEPVDEAIFLKLLAEGKILLIFDAFDEMATMSNPEITLTNFQQLNEAVSGEAKVILTSRTHYFRDKYEVDRILKKEGKEDMSEHATILYREISGKPEYEIVYLKEFDDTQVQAYLGKALKEEWQEAYQKIKNVYNLEDLSHRPVLLDMIVKTLPRIELDKEKKFNVVHLYEAYTQSWFDREDHRLRITKQGKEELVEALAYSMWQKGVKSIHYSELSDMLSHYLKDKIHTTRDLEAADHEVRTASFLVRDEEGNYGFVHRSFQEFFMARKIKKELVKGQSKILDVRRLSPEIIFFLKHSVENDDILLQPLRRVLAGKYRENISENSLMMFYTIIKMACLDQRFSLDEKDTSVLSTEQWQGFRNCIEAALPKKGRMKMETADLTGSTLSGMVFKKADFKDALLQDCRVTDAVVEDTVFTGATLAGVEFRGTVFKNVVFEKVKAHGANFKDCRFQKCRLMHSDFSKCNFMGAMFEQCEIKNYNWNPTVLY